MEDPRIHVTIDADGLVATVEIDTGDAVEGGSLQQALADAGVVFGIDTEITEKLAAGLAEPDFGVGPTVVAKGQKAEDGTEGVLELDVDVATRAGTLRRDGSLDYREREFVHNVEAGMRVGTYVSPSSGKPGCTVMGQPIAPEPGRETMPDLGDGVSYEPDTGAITALRDGVLLCVPQDHLDVTDFFETDGDVDYRTGNLHTSGSVSVKGSVLANFQVEASGDVVIHGSVEDGSVFAQGNVSVDGGILNGAGGRVLARGDVTMRHANNAVVKAGAHLVVTDHSVGSRLNATHIRVVDGRASVSGGVASSRQSIHVGQAGSPGGAPTILVAGDPSEEKRELTRLRQQLHKQRRNSSKRVDRIRSGSRTKGGKGGREATQLARKLAARQREVRALQDQLSEFAEIQVSGTAHSGVRVRIGDATLDVLDPMQGARFTFDKEHGSIREESLKP